MAALFNFNYYEDGSISQQVSLKFSLNFYDCCDISTGSSQRKTEVVVSCGTSISLWVQSLRVVSLHVDTSQETPNGTSAPSHCGSYEYIRFYSSNHITQQAAGNTTQRDLAEKAGIHRSTVSLIESKKRIPTILTCFRLANALNVSLGKIIDGNG
jgi:DNA-binding XRE family transcriptional regulator